MVAATHTWDEVPALASEHAGRNAHVGVPAICDWLSIVGERAIPLCREQMALAEHIERVFASERLWVDGWRLERYLANERYFFGLRPEERFATALWLCTYREDGMPRWDEILYYVGRGYGKTGMLGYWAFCLMSPTNGIPMYNVDVCATTEKQAMVSYNGVKAVLDSDKRFWRQAISWNMVEMTSLDTQSKFKYFTGNSSTKDGEQSGAVFFDEEHAYVTSKSMEVFVGGLGKRPDPRICKTTTDGDVRDGALDSDKERAHAILFDGEPDGGFLPMMFKLDSRDEMEDESKWVKANPRLLDSPVLVERYRKDYADYKRDPDQHVSVPTKRFNLPTIAKSTAVTEWANLTACMRALPDFGDAPCVVGIDFAKTTDMVGACVLSLHDGVWRAECHSWFTTCSLDAKRIKAPLRKWHDEGLMTITDDVEIAPEDVAEWVFAATEGHDVLRIGLDSYRYTIMRKALNLYGWQQRKKGEGVIEMCRPSDIMRVSPIISAAFAKRTIAWGDGNALMRWAANNAKLEPRQNGNFVYEKQDVHARKTDPFMAMVHAFCVSEALEDEAPVEPAPVELMVPLVF